MNNFENLSFIDNPAIARRAGHYVTVTVDMEKILKSWRTSLFSYEWIAPDGRIKSREDLPPGEREKRDGIDLLLARRQPLERPVLGIGLLENIEIGAGRAVFLTLAAYGLREISVHIPKSHEAEFESFLVREANRYKNESGGVFYYILIAIVLLAALSFAITQGGRSSLENLADDQIDLLATGMLEYGNIVKTATAQLRLRGSSFAEMRFAHADLDPAYGVPGAAAADEIFHLSGGGIIYQDAPADAVETAGPYVFTAANAVRGIGTTCAQAACADLIMISPPLQREVCLEINDKLGIDNSGDPSEPPVDSNIDRTTLFDGSEFYARTIGDEAGSAGLEYESAGCFREDASDDYFFYQVLLPR